MTYLDQWKALSGRIHGLMQAAQLHAHFQSVRSGDTFDVTSRLSEQATDILSTTERFMETYQESLPPEALSCIGRFQSRNGRLIEDESGTKDLRQERVRAALVLLGAFETEMSFVLSDVQQSIRARSERAFSHLQRMLVVDHDYREKWRSALQAGETTCEQLGAVHLLLHGIYAFKVTATGARTDLVFQDNVDNHTEEQSVVEGIVLTEWKIAVGENDAPDKFKQAQRQARNYARGVLSATELAAYRYVIVVTQQQVTTPTNLVEDGVVYRHINLAVDPLTPSRVKVN